MDLDRIERELKKRLAYPYAWGRKQNDHFDKRTQFIYDTHTFETLFARIKKTFRDDPRCDALTMYAMNRWYNYWSARAVEEIFCRMPGVEPERDVRNRLADFYVHGIRFDHKTTVFPKSYNGTIEQARTHPEELIRWLYSNQSQGSRNHARNRLFIVLYSYDNEHWKLKAEIAWLRNIIESYVIQFDRAKLLTFNFEDGIPTLADVIWGIKKSKTA